MQLTQMIKRAAQIQPNGVATICGERQHSWQQLRQRVAGLAAVLQAHGVSRGDRVAVLALNSDRYYEYFFAVAWAGAVLVPLNIRWSVKEHVYSLEDSGAGVLVVDDAFAAAAEQVLPQVASLHTCLYIGDKTTPAGMVNSEQALAHQPPIDDQCVGKDQLAGIYYTGGTTGFPKGVMLSHTNLWVSSVSAALGMEMNQPGMRYLHAAPMFHAADIAMSYASTICGATQVFIPAFACQPLVAAIAAHRITHTLLVPTMINMLLGSGELDSADISSLQSVVYGASPMPEGTLRQAMEQMPRVAFMQAYGQTELAPIATILPSEYHVLEGPKSGKIRSAGRAGVCVEVEVVDPLHQPCAVGTVGEVRVRGGNTMMGYWKKPKESEAVMIDGWIHTGDAGYLDEDGFLFLVDRVKDMIVTGGENVYSAEVESALSRHDAISEVVVIGIPSEQWGEQVHAIVRLKEGQRLSQDELIGFCHQQIAHYKSPRSVEFRREPFPITGAGKLRKADLRAPYWQGHRRRVN
ncbi:Acyl-CoA synthetase (AMP-forming)/AMP-acid ligase II [Ferrimonas sediminum]|uniref:Acyl-CoA synthetase (AMP-forming)/AMP-acid ligase II n=1 Tax=Ferrimonas sediminum TaxID=718193 RepID=A0A1G8VZK6_9GAMM|nr:long-chain-fatty-acid--CoA ligase [Ferrimonas sediminum]SDJ71541.1 Acyl-CoA synthetase (AMP-forming)/AMP-acid ligase II [Ferrimonas sediminum]